MNEVLNIRIKNVRMELKQWVVCRPDLVIGSPFKFLFIFFADLMENILSIKS